MVGDTYLREARPVAVDSGLGTTLTDRIGSMRGNLAGLSSSSLDSRHRNGARSLEELGWGASVWLVVVGSIDLLAHGCTTDGQGEGKAASKALDRHIE